MNVRYYVLVALLFVAMIGISLSPVVALASAYGAMVALVGGIAVGSLAIAAILD